MKGSEVLAEIEKAEENIRQADRLEEYFRENPEASEQLSEAAGLSTQASALFSSLACCQELRLQALKQALREATINI